MVKLKGPGLAAQASGQLAKQIIFSSSKGRPYLKVFRNPKQPRTKPQVTMRACMEFLSSGWAAVSPADRATWAAAAAAAQVTPFNQYQSYNIKRLSRLQGASHAYPATETGLYATSSGWTATGGVRHIDLSLNVTIPRDTWGFSWWHVPANGIPPTWDDLIVIMPVTGAGIHKATWSPLAPGTYWVAMTQFTTYAKYYDVPLWLSAVVTD